MNYKKTLKLNRNIIFKFSKVWNYYKTINSTKQQSRRYSLKNKKLYFKPLYSSMYFSTPIPNE